MVSWGAPPFLLPSGFWEVGWDILSVCFVWRWLLCSWHLSPPQAPLLFPVFLFFDALSLSYMETARASLCVRACVRLYIHV